jgi:biopolymer transport protein ExbB
MNMPDISALGTTTLIVFVALGILSVAAVTVFFFKIFQFARMGVGRHKSAEMVLDDWLGGRTDQAVARAGERKTVLTRILQSILISLRARPGDSAYAEELGRQTALIELTAMTRRMKVLETVVQAAPMLGLLGTVIGMIDSFGALSQSAGGLADPIQLAGGIWTALTTTAAGLGIALTTYFAATWLEGRIETERLTMEPLISAAIHGRVEAPIGGR